MFLSGKWFFIHWLLQTLDLTRPQFMTSLAMKGKESHKKKWIFGLDANEKESLWINRHLLKKNFKMMTPISNTLPLSHIHTWSLSYTHKNTLNLCISLSQTHTQTLSLSLSRSWTCATSSFSHSCSPHATHY